MLRVLFVKLKNFFHYAATHGLIYNVKKGEFMVFKTAGKCPEAIPSIITNGINLKEVTRFKYLEHILADDLNNDDDIEIAQGTGDPKDRVGPQTRALYGSFQSNTL